MPREAIQQQAALADRYAHVLILDPADLENFATLQKKKVREKEEALMLAVLADAVECFQKNILAEDERGKKTFREAEAWILESNYDWVFSFQSICEALGLNSDYLRRGLLQWKEKHRKQYLRPPLPKRRFRRNVAHLRS